MEGMRNTKALKCDMCGGELIVLDNTGLAECERCATKHRLESPLLGADVNITEKNRLLQKARTFVKLEDTEGALRAYRHITEEYPEVAEGWWEVVRLESKNLTDFYFLYEEKVDGNRAVVTKKPHVAFEYAMKLLDEPLREECREQYESALRRFSETSVLRMRNKLQNKLDRERQERREAAQRKAEEEQEQKNKQTRKVVLIVLSVIAGIILIMSYPILVFAPLIMVGAISGGGKRGRRR